MPKPTEVLYTAVWSTERVKKIFWLKSHTSKPPNDLCFNIFHYKGPNFEEKKLVWNSTTRGLGFPVVQKQLKWLFQNRKFATSLKNLTKFTGKLDKKVKNIWLVTSKDPYLCLAQDLKTASSYITCSVWRMFANFLQFFWVFCSSFMIALTFFVHY